MNRVEQHEHSDSVRLVHYFAVFVLEKTVAPSFPQSPERVRTVEQQMERCCDHEDGKEDTKPHSVNGLSVTIATTI